LIDRKLSAPTSRASHRAAVLLLAIGLVAGASARAADSDDGFRPLTMAQRTAMFGSDIVMRALALLGVPYRWGGDDAVHGFDCSGFVRRVFADLFNLDLPHRSDQIHREGRPVSRDQLEAGDLVFFNTMRQPFSHVAIYIGDGRFVHAPGRGGQVRIDALDEPYWRQRFSGARRLVEAAATPAAAGDTVSRAGP